MKHLRYIHLTKCGKSKFVSTSEEDEIILTNTEFDLNSFTPCQILVENITNPNIQPQGNISQKFDIKSNIVHSAPATILSSFSPLVEGNLSDDSFVLNDALPSQTGVEGTYTFMYDRDLEIGDTIELTLPGWGGSDLITSSKCGVLASTFSVNISTNVNNEFMIVLTILGQKLYRDSPCSIRIKGLTNPSHAMPANSKTIKHSVSSINGGTYTKQITKSSPIREGRMSNDELTLSNNFPGQNSVTLTYKFSYNRQLGINDVIELKLPMWSSPLPVSTNSLCGDTKFALEEIGIDSDSEYGLRFTILDVSVPANKLCKLMCLK